MDAVFAYGKPKRVRFLNAPNETLNYDTPPQRKRRKASRQNAVIWIFGPNMVCSLHWINSKRFEFNKIDQFETRAAEPLFVASIPTRASNPYTLALYQPGLLPPVAYRRMRDWTTARAPGFVDPCIEGGTSDHGTQANPGFAVKSPLPAVVDACCPEAVAEDGTPARHLSVELGIRHLEECPPRFAVSAVRDSELVPPCAEEAGKRACGIRGRRCHSVLSSRVGSIPTSASVNERLIHDDGHRSGLTQQSLEPRNHQGQVY